jgi:shikimate kinase
MADKAWVLLGMMGAGKSAVGRALAALSGRQHVDTDQMLQARLGRPISQLFRIYGEQTFRDHETSILRSLQPQRQVISTGGGIVTRDENWQELKRLGVTVFLDADISDLVRRLAASKKRRPLLEVDDWESRVEAILAERRPLYARADLRVCISGVSIEECAALVLKRIQEVED